MHEDGHAIRTVLESNSLKKTWTAIVSEFGAIVLERERYGTVLSTVLYFHFVKRKKRSIGETPSGNMKTALGLVLWAVCGSVGNAATRTWADSPQLTSMWESISKSDVSKYVIADGL